jgi:hypothetical protein
MEEIIIQEKLHEINAKVFRAKLPALTRLIPLLSTSGKTGLLVSLLSKVDKLEI